MHEANEGDLGNQDMTADTENIEERGSGNAENAGGDGPANGAADAPAAMPPQGRDLAAEYLDALQRERASFINYKRRTEQERAEASHYATAGLIKKLLPVVDDFDRALASIPEEERKSNRWVEGVELIARKLHSILEQEGVEPIEALGQPFDPNVHEAVAFEDKTGEGDEHQDTVAQVFSRGYKLHDRVLRPAMVKVLRG